VNKLRETPKKNKELKYQKFNNVIAQEGKYIFPSKLFSPLAIKYINETVRGPNFRAHIIPELLTTGFGMDLSMKVNTHTDLKEMSLEKTFFYMKDLRNDISHGKNPRIGFEKAMDLVRFLRVFSVEVENHLLKHFFLIER